MKRTLISMALILSTALILLSACSAAAINTNEPTATKELPTSEPTEIPSPVPTEFVEPTTEPSPEPTTAEAYPAPSSQPSKSTNPYPYPAPHTLDEAEEVTIDTAEAYRALAIQEPQRLVWNPNGTVFALIGYKSLAYYSFPELELLHQVQLPDSEYLLDASPDGIHYAASTDMQNIEIINWQSDERTFIKPEQSFMAAQFSPDGTQMLLGLMDERAAVLVNVNDGILTNKLTGFETAAPVYSVFFASSPDHLLWLARATLQISEISTNTLGQIFSHEDFIGGFASNPDNTLILTSAAGMYEDEFAPLLFFWDARSGELIYKMPLENIAYSITFSPNGRLIALNVGKNILLVDASSFEIIQSFTAHQDSITQLTFTPNGKILSSVGVDQEIKFWQLD